MTAAPHISTQLPSPDALRALVAPYEGADDRRAWIVLVTSLAPYPLLWWLTYRALGISYWLAFPLALVTAGFAVRTFIVQHDCGHGSFFTSAWLRTAVGRACSLVTLVPFGYFRRLHGAHHATSGKLHQRGVDIETMTVREYRALAPAARLRYRLTRHPIVLFGIAPLLYFVVALWLPWIARRGWKRERAGIVLTDLALAAVYGAVVFVVGLRAFLLVQLTITAAAAGVGVWLFYVQHQFEGTYWAGEGEWDFGRAALEGSSHLALPAVLDWFTGHIGLHHVHHLSPRIPSYRLGACHLENDVLAGVPRIGLGDALRCSRLKLWDEEAKRLVGWPA